MKRILCSTLLAAAIIVTAPAGAAVQSWHFSGVLESGILAGESFSGSFSVDDAALAGFGSEWVVVDAVGVDFHDAHFTLADAAAAPEAAFFDGILLGLSYTVESSDPQFSLIAGYENAGEAFLAYDTVAGLSGTGSLIYAAAVPEADRWTLMLAGLAGVAAVARRRIG